jgi:hypothetical protein
VFCVKYRRKALTAPILARLQDGPGRMLDALKRYIESQHRPA